MSMNVVITGANRGIGLSLSKVYAGQGHQVYAVCRKPSIELETLGVHIIAGINLRDVLDYERLRSRFQGVAIDLLINNAGVLRDEQLGRIDFDAVQEQWEVNALAPLRVTDALLENLNRGAKVALITSRMGSIADNTSGGRYGYRMSKAALNAAGVSLAHDLKPRGISVALLHPGLVGTDMIGGVGDVTPDQAAQRLVTRIEALSLENTGTFWHANGEVLPW